MITLRGITWDHPRGFDSVAGSAREWERLHPDIHVEWSARSLQRFADQSLSSMSDEYDLMVIDHPHIPEAHHLSLLLPMDGKGYDDQLRSLAAQTIGQSHASYAHGGHQYGLAIDAAAQVSMYRPDLLPVPPADWDEVIELAQAGRVLWPGKPVDAISSLITLAANAGRPFNDTPGQLLDRETGREAMALLQQLADLVPAECLAQNPIEVAETMAAGDRFSYCPLAYGYTNYSRSGYRAHRLRYVDIPAGAAGVAGSCLGGAGISISATTAHPEEALQHAFWLAEPDVQRGVYYFSGGQPGYSSAWDDEAVNADCLDFFTGTRATMDQSWLRTRYPGWLDVFDEVGILVNRALRGLISHEEALDAAEASYRESLRRA